MRCMGEILPDPRCPQGFKDPNNRVLGPNYYNINGILALKVYNLGPWTLGGAYFRTCQGTYEAILCPSAIGGG